MSQVLGSFSRLGARPPNIVKDPKSLTKEPESISCRLSSKIPNFLSWVKKIFKGKGREKLVCYHAVQGGRVLLDHTAFRVIFLWWKNSLQVSTVSGRGSERGQKRGN